MEPYITEIVLQSKASIVHGDLLVLFDLLKSFDIENVLEIGTWKGFSMQNWTRAFPYANIVTVEKDKKNDQCIEIEHENYYYLWGHDSQEESTLDEIINIFHQDFIDFIFIDGAHDLEGVTRDYERYGSLVRKGGIIVFHDACYHADGTEEVDILWNELKRINSYVEIKTTPSSTDIGVIFK